MRRLVEAIVRLLCWAQVKTDKGICFKSYWDDEPVWGGTEDSECGCVRHYFPIFCQVAIKNNDLVRIVKFEGVAFNNDEFDVLVKTMEQLKHVETFYWSDNKVEDHHEQSSTKKLGSRVLQALQKHNPNITGEIDGVGIKKSTSTKRGKRKRG